MISDDKQYEFVTRRISDLANATHSALKLFLPTFSAILGGSIWLRLQIKDSTPPSYAYLSDALILVLTAQCIVIVYDNHRAWWGYRMLLTKLLATSAHPAPPPVFWPTAIIELSMCLAMLGAGALFVIFNPFNI